MTSKTLKFKFRKKEKKNKKLGYTYNILGACIEYNLYTKNVTCNGSNNGMASVTITNGNGPFMYLYYNSFIYLIKAQITILN